MTTGNDRRDPNLVTFNVDESLDFIRFIFEDKPLPFRKQLETVFEHMKEEPAISLMVSIKQGFDSPQVDKNDMFAGLVMGINLALACSDAYADKVGSIPGFLKELRKKGENVADIADAFKKRAEARV